MPRRTAGCEGYRENMAAQDEMPRKETPASGDGSVAPAQKPERRSVRKGRGGDSLSRQKAEAPGQPKLDLLKLDALPQAQPDAAPPSRLDGAQEQAARPSDIVAPQDVRDAEPPSIGPSTDGLKQDQAKALEQATPPPDAKPEQPPQAAAPRAAPEALRPEPAKPEPAPFDPPAPEGLKADLSKSPLERAVLEKYSPLSRFAAPEAKPGRPRISEALRPPGLRDASRLEQEPVRLPAMPDVPKQNLPKDRLEHGASEGLSPVSRLVPPESRSPTQARAPRPDWPPLDPGAPKAAPEPPKPEAARPDAPTHASAEQEVDGGRLKQTATTISEALRRAEIANHRELAEAIAPLLVHADERGEAAESPAWMRRFVEIGAGVARKTSASLAANRPAGAGEQKSKLNRLLALDRANCNVMASWRLEGVSAEPTSILVGAIKQYCSRELAGAQGEMRALNFHGGRVLVRASARLIAAAQFLDEPHADEKARLDAALKTLIKKESLVDADLAGVAARLRAPEAPPVLRNRLVVAAAAALIFGAALALTTRGGEAPEARLPRLFAQARDAQPQLAGWPLMVSVDANSHVASVSGLAPADADLEVFKNLPAATPWRWEVHVARVANAEALQNADARAKSLAEKLENAEGRLAALDGRLAALDERLASLEKWRAERAAEAEGPAARLARLARNTVVLFLDDDNFFDPDLARRQLGEIAALLKQTDQRLRIVGYTDAHGSAPKNLALSRARANAVKAGLVEEGIDPKRLVAVGRADQAPIAPETSSDRRRNRRVTFEVPGATD